MHEISGKLLYPARETGLCGATVILYTLAASPGLYNIRNVVHPLLSLFNPQNVNLIRRNNYSRQQLDFQGVQSRTREIDPNFLQQQAVDRGTVVSVVWIHILMATHPLLLLVFKSGEEDHKVKAAKIALSPRRLEALW